MDTTEQEKFEEEVMLESELGYMCTSEGSLHKITIEEIKHKSLDEIQLEKGRSLNGEEKKLLNIFIWYKLKQLTKEEQELAIKYYIEGKTEKEISEEMVFNINGNSDKRKKGKISQMGVSKKIRIVNEKLKL